MYLVNFIFIDADAIIASRLLNLKLTCLTEKIVKCGFPISSLEKYKNILNKTAYSIKIIDNSMDTSYTINNYELDNTTYNLLLKIQNIDTNLLSIKEAYQFIDDIKLKANSILEKSKKDS